MVDPGTLDGASKDIVKNSTLEFRKGCNVLRLRTRNVARGSRKLSETGYSLVIYFQIKDVYFDHSHQWIYGSNVRTTAQAKAVHTCESGSVDSENYYCAGGICTDSFVVLFSLVARAF